jgi:hypothetical protein
LRGDVPLRQGGFLRRLVAPRLHQMSVIEPRLGEGPVA